MIYDNLIKNKEILENAIELDNSKWGGSLKFEDLLKVGRDVSERDYKKEVSSSNTYIVLYNGDPKITLELAILGIKSSSNMIFMIYDDDFATNNLLIKIMQQLAEETGDKSFVKLYNNVRNEDIRKSTEFADKIIYIGDIFEYHNVKRQYNLPIIYNGYGDVTVYTDERETFNDELIKINNYAFENDIVVNFHEGDLEKELEYINIDVTLDTCVIFSNDENKINLFKEKVNSKKIFVNESPFTDYRFDFDISELTTE